MKTMPNAKAIVVICVAVYLSASVMLISVEELLAGNINVDTGQRRCYGNAGEISCPNPGQPFYGQDAQFHGNFPSFRDNGDGTVTDRNTGLMWSKAVNAGKVTPVEAEKIARGMNLGGYSDWRVPTIKELYSLIDFRGYTGAGHMGAAGGVPSNAIPFINTDYFDFAYGDIARGERYIDAQWLSSTKYVSTTMGGMETVFGVNFADGRIKGYGYKRLGTSRVVKVFYARYVRGKPYGVNHWVDNGNGTVSDQSTGLMWMQMDSGRAMNWQQALAHADRLSYAGFDDWRLPNAKELQYIVDYSRSPDTTDSPAIDPLFKATAITNEAGQKDYPFYWTSTTHLDGPRPGENAVYIAFGRAIGRMRGRVMDVHGAGAQRSDPKAGSAGLGHGPQGDARRVLNFVRCVRGGQTMSITGHPPTVRHGYPDKIRLSPNNSGGAARQEQVKRFRQQPQRPGAMPGRPPGGMGFVQRLDRDGDGKVSRSEFDGPPDRFDFHDTNRDGYLSEDEAPKGPPPGARHPRY